MIGDRKIHGVAHVARGASPRFRDGGGRARIDRGLMKERAGVPARQRLQRRERSGRVGSQGGDAQAALPRRRHEIERSDGRPTQVGARRHFGARKHLPVIVDGNGDGNGVPEIHT